MIGSPSGAFIVFKSLYATVCVLTSNFALFVAHPTNYVDNNIIPKYLNIIDCPDMVKYKLL